MIYYVHNSFPGPFVSFELLSKYIASGIPDVSNQPLSLRGNIFWLPGVEELTHSLSDLLPLSLTSPSCLGTPKPPLIGLVVLAGKWLLHDVSFFATHHPLMHLLR